MSLVNGELQELAFDNYAVSFKSPGVHKEMGFGIPVADYTFKVRKASGNAVLVDINGGDFGSVTLVHQDGNYVLIIREYASSSINQTISVVPTVAVPTVSAVINREVRRRRQALAAAADSGDGGVLRNPWTRVRVSINGTLALAGLYIDDRLVASLQLPTGIDLTVRQSRFILIFKFISTQCCRQQAVSAL